MEEKKKAGKTEKRLLLACVFFAAAGILLVCARQIPGFAEWYAVHIYKKLTVLFGGVTGMAPFSIVEFGLYIFLAWIPVSGIWMIVKAVHSGKRQRGTLAFQWVWEYCCYSSFFTCHHYNNQELALGSREWESWSCFLWLATLRK